MAGCGPGLGSGTACPGTLVYVTTLENYSLSDRYTRSDGTVFLSGVQALARLPIVQLRSDREAGLSTAAFVSGYQGSPLGGFDQELARALKAVGDLPITFRPAVNEELAATAVMGSQLASTMKRPSYDGVLGLWYGKAPGIDRASDALRHAVFAGTGSSSGAVALVGDDPECKSSTLPSSSDMTLINLKMPVLYPADVQEVLTLARHAVAVSRFAGAWSALKIVTAVADGTGTVDLDANEPIVVPEHDGDGGGLAGALVQPNGNLIAPFTNEMEQSIVEVRLPLAVQYSQANNLNETVVSSPDDWCGIVAPGYTYREVLEALRRLGLDGLDDLRRAGIRLMRISMPFPLAPEPIRQFARGLSQVLVVEEKGPALEWMIKDVLYNSAERPMLVGSGDGATPGTLDRHGFLTADKIAPMLRHHLAERIGDRLTPEQTIRERVLIPLSTSRTPYFCSGCPHNWGTKAPEGAMIGAGIGCSGIATLMDESKVGDVTGITCMGSEGSQWIGMESFVEDDHFIQNLGDGTFFHSGQLALQAAVAAGVNMTYKLLYNGTVAMTGGQDPEGQLAVADIATLALTHGVTEVLITTEDPQRYDAVTLPANAKGRATRVWHRRRIVEAQEYLASQPGVTLLVHDQACAAQVRRLRKRGLAVKPTERVVINHRICEACGDCGEVSNCLSVHTMPTDLGPKTTIDQTTCNLDFSCLDGDCPSFMTVEVSDEQSAAPVGGAVVGALDELRNDLADASSLPMPQSVPAVADTANIRMAGIGGTGVVTASQILGTAAMFDGWTVRGLDQTGLSQKAGPVVSDLRLSADEAPDSNLIGGGQADLIVGFDLLVAVSDKTLASASAERTAIIASGTPTPTGEMVGNLDVDYPDEAEMRGRTEHCSIVAENRYVDAAGITKAVFGDAATANVFVLGVAVQSGRLPVSPESMERAIELNGVAVDANTRSFRLGRTWYENPTVTENRCGVGSAGVGGDRERQLGPGTVAVDPLPEELKRLVTSMSLEPDEHDRMTLLASDLVLYQNRRYSKKFLDVLGRMADAEVAATGSTGAFTSATGQGLHKLMAYKDEYEVARLLLGPEATEAAASVGGRQPNVVWRLHPPLLRSLGMSNKLRVGSRWGKPVMQALVRLRRVRGTVVDPFGYAGLRRRERAIIEQYIATIDLMAANLNGDNVEWAASVAGAAMDVRGYEDLKAERLEVFEERLAAARTELRSSMP